MGTGRGASMKKALFEATAMAKTPSSPLRSIAVATAKAHRGAAIDQQSRCWPLPVLALAGGDWLGQSGGNPNTPKRNTKGLNRNILYRSYRHEHKN